MRPEKKAIVDEIRSEINDSLFLIVTDYKGMSVSQTEELKSRLHDVDARFRVVQNRLTKIALDDAQEGVQDHLKGPSAMILGAGGEVVEAAKVLKKFLKETGLPTVKVGSLRGVILSEDDVKELAEMPPREVLLGTLVGTIAAPMTQLVGVFQQKTASLVYVLKAIQDKKEQEA